VICQGYPQVRRLMEEHVLPSIGTPLVRKNFKTVISIRTWQRERLLTPQEA